MNTIVINGGVNKLELMKIVVSDEFNLLKDESQTDEDYQNLKESYKKKIFLEMKKLFGQTKEIQNEV